MKKILVILATVMIGAMAASANSVGVFGSIWDTEDLGPGFGGGVKFKGDLAEYFAFELRASGVTGFDDWEGDDNLFIIPLEAGLLLNLPLGDDIPITIYGGGGGGYAIIPEADDVDFDDDFCFYGVGGLEIALGTGVALFGEVLYRFLEVDGAEVGGIEVGGRGEEAGELTGLGFNAGLLFSF